MGHRPSDLAVRAFHRCQGASTVGNTFKSACRIVFASDYRQTLWLVGVYALQALSYGVGNPKVCTEGKPPQDCARLGAPPGLRLDGEPSSRASDPYANVRRKMFWRPGRYSTMPGIDPKPPREADLLDPCRVPRCAKSLIRGRTRNRLGLSSASLPCCIQ